VKQLNVEKTQKLLGRIMEFELAGVVRYTHYSLMVAGPNRIPIVQFMKTQASESLLHAQQAGEILTGLGGHPTLQIAPIDETYRHSVRDILEESLVHEQRALKIYKELLDVVEDRSVYLEEFARTQIAQEEVHGLELRKMLRDIIVMSSGVDDEAVSTMHPSQKSPKTRSKAARAETALDMPSAIASASHHHSEVDEGKRRKKRDKTRA
jgi:bacterioferritin